MHNRCQNPTSSSVTSAIRQRGTARCGVVIGTLAAMIAAAACFAFSVVYGVAPAAADPWLDRLERNLRRIETASKYTEPMGAGSKAAAKMHNECIHKNVETACEQLIWRSPELLPIRDWAVGTAHIKRGELREKRGDAAGAIEDYRDALGYHQFPHLNVRIKRLTLRQEKFAKTAAKTTKKKASEDRQSDAQHPIVVVEGWAATVADPEAVQQLLRAEKDAAAAKDAASETVPAAKDTARRVTQAIPTTSDAAASESKRPELVAAKSAEAATTSRLKPAAPKPPTGSNDETGVRTAALQNAEVRSGLQLASRHAPGSTVVGGELADAQATALPAEKGPKPTITVSRHEGAVRETASAFPVDGAVGKSLDRVRSRTSDILETSALPNSAVETTTGPFSAFSGLATMMIIALMLCSSLIVAMQRYPVWTFGAAGRKQPKKPILSVDDLEAIIKHRKSDAKLNVADSPADRPPPVMATPALPNPKKSADERAAASKTQLRSRRRSIFTGGNADRDADTTQADDFERQDGGVQSERNGAAELGTDTTDGAARPSVPTSSTPVLVSDAVSALRSLDESLLRRVSYGSASLLVAGADDAWCSAIASKLDEDRRSELLSRLERWDADVPQVAGLFNPFAYATDASDTLLARQRFNAAFEFYLSIFESIFGTQFVYAQKVMLRHVVTLMQVLPKPGLKSLYECLENRRASDTLRAGLRRIDNVSTRLFFTTTFSSDDFTETASFMQERLGHVISNDVISHLVCEAPVGDRMTALTEQGGWVVIPCEGEAFTDRQTEVLLRSVLSVLALRGVTSGAREASGEVTTVSVFVPDKARALGGQATDLSFYTDQVTRAGYNML